MIHILVIDKDSRLGEEVARVLGGDGRFALKTARSAARARALLDLGDVDAAIVGQDLDDMSGLAFLREVVPRYPFINCALVSPLYPDEFHRETEGLGLFMQLPVPLAGDSLGQLAERIRTIVRTETEVRTPCGE